jgi:hypothetical protein
VVGKKKEKVEASDAEEGKTEWRMHAPLLHTVETVYYA